MDSFIPCQLESFLLVVINDCLPLHSPALHSISYRHILNYRGSSEARSEVSALLSGCLTVLENYSKCRI